MLEGIGVKNLRSFSDLVLCELKPLTVLLGRNSSGKSSLIRLFPLLRQSVEETTTGPILWYGRYVDYGDFNEAISKKSKDSDIIHFRFDIKFAPSRPYHAYFLDEGIYTKKIIPAMVELNITEQEQKTFTKSLSFTIDGSTITVIPDFKKNKTRIRANSKHFIHEEEAEGTSSKDYKFFPKIRWYSDQGKKKVNFDEDEQVLDNETLIYLEYSSISSFSKHNHLFAKKISSSAASCIKKYFHKNTNLETIAKSIHQITTFSKEDLIQELRIHFNKQIYFISNLENTEIREKLLDTLFPFILLKNYHRLAASINESLRRTFTSVKYLAPIRANSERFYRFQDLQVDEMDHTGSNVAMILNAFSKNEKQKFKEWTLDHFGFEAFVKTDGSHYAIMIKTDNDTEEHNISDMGYGFSQVLPIIMSIWLEMYNPNGNNNEIIFVIEQPELHLHPAYQKKVANLFAKIIKISKVSGRAVKFVFETHSQSMIDAIGENINAGIISKHDANILIFEKSIEHGSTIISSEFDDNGYLVNWPVGFFSGE